MQQVLFSCSTLAGTGKKGVLKKDENGYYTLPIGGLNVFNSVGDFYTYEQAKDLFSSSSTFMRRVRSGALKGEYGHPKSQPGQSYESFAERVLTIEEKNICTHFSEIWLDFDNVRDKEGKKVIAIMAKLAPSGPMGDAIARSLENPNEDVCYSIRSFTRDTYIAGVKHRALAEIVTWDYVNEPGINFARKYSSPALESLQEQVFTRKDLIRAIKHMDQGIGMESAKMTGHSLFKSLGWSFEDSDIPNYMRW
jgi:hypothetical protein